MSPQRPLAAADALRLAAHALGGRITIPLSWVRSRLSGLGDKVLLEVSAATPGLLVRGEAHALGAAIVFSTRVDVGGIEVNGEQRTIRCRLTNVELRTDENAPGPLADAIRNGMIDTTQPGTLIGNMMALPDMIVEAQGQDVVVDLMRVPAIARDDLTRTAVATTTSLLGVTAVHVEDDAIQLKLGVLPGGPKEAVLSTARAVLTPVVRYLWPQGAP